VDARLLDQATNQHMMKALCLTKQQKSVQFSLDSGVGTYSPSKNKPDEAPATSRFAELTACGQVEDAEPQVKHQPDLSVRKVDAGGGLKALKAVVNGCPVNLKLLGSGQNVTGVVQIDPEKTRKIGIDV
jgi:hypothetical protein